jgi:hypothetical protein
MQVADRLHLVQNLAEGLDQVLNAHIQALNALNDARYQTPIPQPDGALAAPVPPPRYAQTRSCQPSSAGPGSWRSTSRSGPCIGRGLPATRWPGSCALGRAPSFATCGPLNKLRGS